MLSPSGPSKLEKVEAGSLQSLRIHLPKGAPGCQTQDSATGTSPTWPLASDWVTTPRSPRTSVPATSIKRTLLSNPKGPRKGACSSQDATRCWQTAGGYCPRTMHPIGMWQILINDVPNHRWRLTRKALSAAVAASEGQCLGSCPRSAKISMSSQDDLGQGPACSALAMDP